MPLAALVLSTLVSAAPPSPPPADVARAVYPRHSAATSGTGERGKVCNDAIEGELTATPLAVRPWKGLGRDQVVAAFSIWVRPTPRAGEPDGGDDGDGWAQACGPRPCQVALLDRRPDGGLSLVARSPLLRCELLDLAPYRILPGETLVGARGAWMNHGFGESRLTLLRAAGDRLVPVLEVLVDSVDPEMLECHGTVSVVPRGAEPADLKVTWKVKKSVEEEIVDAAGRRTSDFVEKKLPDETLTFRLDGKRYAPVGKPPRCIRGW